MSLPHTKQTENNPPTKLKLTKITQKPNQKKEEKQEATHTHPPSFNKTLAKIIG